MCAALRKEGEGRGEIKCCTHPFPPIKTHYITIEGGRGEMPFQKKKGGERTKERGISDALKIQ